MFEDEHLLEGGRCGSASHCETLSIAVASLSHQIILSQPPIAFTCSISLSAVFPLRTSPTWNPNLELGIGTGNPGVFQGYPYPYPGKPVPVFKGTGFEGYGYGCGGRCLVVMRIKNKK